MYQWSPLWYFHKRIQYVLIKFNHPVFTFHLLCFSHSINFDSTSGWLFKKFNLLSLMCSVSFHFHWKWQFIFLSGWITFCYMWIFYSFTHLLTDTRDASVSQCHNNQQCTDTSLTCLSHCLWIRVNDFQAVGPNPFGGLISDILHVRKLHYDL